MIHIHTISVSPEEDMVQISFIDDADTRGKVSMEKAVVIDLDHPDYKADAALMLANAHRLLANALEDFEESEPSPTPEPKVPSDEDEGMGMGHGDQS